MNATAKSFIAAGALLASAGAILVGTRMRDGVDVGGGGPLQAANVEGLVASRDPREVPEGDYFYEISNLLKQRYVEPIKDEQKLALGAVRGMVGSLGDPDSIYLDASEFKVHSAMRKGRFEGIGAQLELVNRTESPKEAKPSGQPMSAEEILATGIRIPRLTVVAVVPGGPAERAGVRTGDWVEFVDDHWVPNAEAVAAFRILEQNVRKGKAKMETLIKMRQELRAKTKRTVLPLKARSKLTMGLSGKVKVVWNREGKQFTTEIVRSACQGLAFSDSDGVIRLPLQSGDDDRLREAISGKDEVTIDIRQNALGDPNVMRACLEVIAPKGTFGAISRSKHDFPLEVKGGNSHPPKVTLLVDKSTRGSAEVFAQVLLAAGIANVSGGPMAGHSVLIEDVPLPDGSGYTLAVGEYKVKSK